MARKVFFRQRKPSINSMLGITQAKRKFARATGIPTTKAGRKRKAMNALTGGAYGKYQRTRANINRPFKRAKRVTRGCGCGCMLPLVSLAVAFGVVLMVLIF